jgi:pimeloyl-ACP methyl ester carboxylesterase
VTNRVTDLGFTRSTGHGTRFDHFVVRSPTMSDCASLRVYVEHDGTPWSTPNTVASDPTPRVPLALELMGRDTGCRVYVGRPCYFGHQFDPGCDARWWTSHRYSDEVVLSMAAVATRLVDDSGANEVVLIGYSGGGTIAWLMARHMPSVSGVVTIAANLDIRAWTELHGFSPLVASANPAGLDPLPEGVRQWHFVGGNDRNVPPGVVRGVVARQPSAQLLEISEFDHVCCWISRWPELLRALDHRIPVK